MRLLNRHAPDKNAKARQRRWHWRRAGIIAVAMIATVAVLGFSVQRSGLAAIAAARAERAFFSQSARAGLAVNAVEIEGRHHASSAALLAALGVARGTPILAVDPEQAKRRLEQVAWVKSASVYRKLPGTLFIRLAEQEPLAFWQRDKTLVLIDRDGRAIATSDLAAFASLPILVGDDAPGHAADLIQLLASEPELARHVGAAVRVGGRRWNLHFDQGVDVALPEQDPAQAWYKLARIEHDDQVLERDVTLVDLRLPDRIFLKVSPELIKPEAKKGTKAARPT